MNVLAMMLSRRRRSVPVTNEVGQSEIIDVTAETVDDEPSNDAPQAADSKQDNTAADSKPASDNEQVNPVGTPSAAVADQNNEVVREADNALNHSDDRVKEDDATTQVLDSYIPDDTPAPTDTLEHTAYNNDSVEEKNTDEPHDDSRTEKEDDGDDQPIVSREYFDEQMSACRPLQPQSRPVSGTPCRWISCWFLGRTLSYATASRGQQ